jgi:hypothetical protein
LIDRGAGGRPTILSSQQTLLCVWIQLKAILKRLWLRGQGPASLVQLFEFQVFNNSVDFSKTASGVLLAYFGNNLSQVLVEKVEIKQLDSIIKTKEEVGSSFASTE